MFTTERENEFVIEFKQCSSCKGRQNTKQRGLGVNCGTGENNFYCRRAVIATAFFIHKFCNSRNIKLLIFIKT